MNVSDWLSGKGLADSVVEELVTLLPDEMPESAMGWFYTGDYTMTPDRWSHWPEQSRFVFVGQCPNGSAIAIDPQDSLGAVFYVATDAIGSDPASGEFSVRVADSPAEFATLSEQNDFPLDSHDAI